MTRTSAEAWLRETFNVPRETLNAVEAFVGAVLDEQSHQNLIAASTLETIWHRHVLDSAQLLLHAPTKVALWVDVGSGAGFPGIIVGILRPDVQVFLLEPRAKRADFLSRAAVRHSNIKVLQSGVETLHDVTPDVISARAVAQLDPLFAMTFPLSSKATTWLLHKGASAASELEIARKSWQGEFRLEASVTDPAAAIVIAKHVRRREVR